MRLVVLAALLALGNAASAATLVIDTGHSRTKPGSRGADGTMEFTFNRKLATALINELRRRSHTVVDVHADGDDASLASRTRQTAGADLFLSIHHDSIQQHYLDAGRAHEFAGHAVLASALAKQVDPSLRCALTIGDAMLKAGSRPSRYHAEQIPGENRPLIDAARGIHRYDHLVVLKQARSPALLLEAGVIVNPYQVPLLNDPRWIAGVAHHLADGIEACTGRNG